MGKQLNCSGEVGYSPLSEQSFEPLRCCLLSLGAEHEAARICRRVERCGSLAAAWARAGQKAGVGVLSPQSPGPAANRFVGFAKGLAEQGYVEGQNVAIEYRWADGRYDHMPALAADL